MPRKANSNAAAPSIIAVRVQNLSMRYSKLRSFLAMIAEGQMDLFRQAVRNMLAALQMPDVDDNELHDLTLRVGHTGKFKRLLTFNR
jgi:hypothetical protein